MGAKHSEEKQSREGPSGEVSRGKPTGGVVQADAPVCKGPVRGVLWGRVAGEGAGQRASRPRSPECCIQASFWTVPAPVFSPIGQMNGLSLGLEPSRGRAQDCQARSTPLLSSCCLSEPEPPSGAAALPPALWEPPNRGREPSPCGAAPGLCAPLGPCRWRTATLPVELMLGSPPVKLRWQCRAPEFN